jgi:phosphoserine phosphatase RsbU/P
VRYLWASEDALVGGDFYDVAVTRQGLRVVVGDVKGKGLEAVQLAALVLASFRAEWPDQAVGLARLLPAGPAGILPNLGPGCRRRRSEPALVAAQG